MTNAKKIRWHTVTVTDYLDTLTPDGSHELRETTTTTAKDGRGRLISETVAVKHGRTGETRVIRETRHSYSTTSAEPTDY